MKRALPIVFIIFSSSMFACTGSDGSQSEGDGDSTIDDGDGDTSGSGGAAGDGDSAASCAETCPGCCDGETCVETPTDAQCGRDGAECAACLGWEYCVSDPNSFVGVGICETESTSMWEITVDSVSAYSQQPGPDDWDLLDGPDLFVCLEVDSVERGCTSACTDSYSCSINEVVGTVSYSEVRDYVVALEVYDFDVDDDDYGGGVLLWVDHLEAGRLEVTSEESTGFETLVVGIEPAL